MRHKPSVSAQNPDLHLIFSSAVLASSITVYRQILFQTYLGVSGMDVCKEASACPLLHRRGAIDLADFRQSIAGLLFLLFYIFLFSRLLIVFCPPPSCSSPNSNQMLSIGDSATCIGEMYVPCCGFWR